MVPKDVLNALRQNQDPSPEPSSFFDRTDLGPYAKWRLYEQGKLRLDPHPEPFRIQLEERPAHPIKQEIKTELDEVEEVAKTLPNKFRQDGIIILRQLDASNRISWNDDGAVTIDGKYIRGTNIAFLLIAWMKKARARLRGYPEFKRLLEELGINRGTKRRHDEVIDGEEEPRRSRRRLWQVPAPPLPDDDDASI